MRFLTWLFKRRRPPDPPPAPPPIDQQWSELAHKINLVMDHPLMREKIATLAKGERVNH